jgi:outer membrane autotransporter protein
VENARLFSAALGRYFSARRRGTPALAMQGEVSPAGGGGGPLLARSNADPRLLAAAMDEGNGNGGSGPIPAPSGERRTGGEGAPKLFGDSDWSAFARGLGIFQNQDTTDDRLGYRADAGGGLFGIDRQITPDLTAGLSLGYIRTDAELAQNRGEHGIDTVRIGPYLSYSPERWFFDGSMTYGFHHFDSDRSTPASGGDAESEHDGHDLLAQGRVGYDFKVYSTELTLTPEGSLQYLYLYEEAFTERGPGALEVDSRDSHSLRSRLGFSLSYAFESSAVTLVPELFAGWEREYLGDDESIEARFVGGGDAFSVGVGDPEEDSAAVSAGVTALLSEDFSAFARYDGNYSSGGEIHGITGGIRISF